MKLSKTKKIALIIYGGFILLGFVYYLLIRYFDVGISCYYYENLGIKCHGCGMTRMFLSLTKLQFGKAFMYNPFMFIMLFLWNAVGLMCLFERPKFITKPKFLYIMMIISIIGMLFFTFFRNIY